MQEIEFIADESCDFIVVKTLRAIGYDVISISESYPSSPDYQVLQIAIETKRILITEDKDFGEWVFAHGEEVPGVVLIRFPGNARLKLSEEMKFLVQNHGSELNKSFVVLEPGRARIRRI